MCEVILRNRKPLIKLLRPELGGCFHVAQNQPTTSDRINALLEEYDACYQTRDHYLTLQWTIGSIFIAAALILLGASFQVNTQTTPNKVGVLFVSLMALFLFLIWFAYFQHVQPMIDESIKRAREIEDWLNYHYYRAPVILLQSYLSRHRKGRGKIITACLLILVLLAVVVRVILIFT
jgi:hypothetical protein